MGFMVRNHVATRTGQISPTALWGDTLIDELLHRDLGIMRFLKISLCLKSMQS